MRINRKSRVGNHYMNHLNVVVNNNWNKGTGDSLGRTARAALIFDDVELLLGIKNFFIKGPEGHDSEGIIFVTRYPGTEHTDYLRGNSRDHVIKAVAAMKLKNQHIWVKNFVANKAKRPCIDHRYTIFQKIWFKALYSHLWTLIYVLVKLPELLLRAGFDKLLRRLGKFSKPATNPTEFEKNRKKPTKLQRWINRSWLMMPTFASFYTIYEMMSLHTKWLSKLMLRIHSINFEKHNYVARAMCGVKVNFPDEYIPTRKNRWSVRLDETNDRDMRVYRDDTPENNLELAMFMYYKHLNR